jgi:predicted transcriptional regulator
MSIKIQIVRDGRIIFEVPLVRGRTLFDLVQREIEEVERDLDNLIEFFDALSNKDRLKMLMDFLTTEKISWTFSDIKRHYEMNPKLVSFNLKKMLTGGLMMRKGREYYLSTAGLGGFLTVSIFLRRVLNELGRYERERVRVKNK